MGDELTEYLSAPEYAARVGRPVHEIRAALRIGAVPGALRIGAVGSPWRIPNPDVLLANDDGPRANAGAVSDATDPGAGDVAHVTSSRVDTVALARRVSAAVGTVSTRPARALTDLCYSVAIVAVRHRPDADGRCQACRWPAFPCPDLVELERAITHTADQVLGGAE